MLYNISLPRHIHTCPKCSNRELIACYDLEKPEEDEERCDSYKLCPNCEKYWEIGYKEALESVNQIYLLDL